jgi:hypothetical protein
MVIEQQFDKFIIAKELNLDPYHTWYSHGFVEETNKDERESVDGYDRGHLKCIPCTRCR